MYSGKWRSCCFHLTTRNGDGLFTYFLIQLLHSVKLSSTADFFCRLHHYYHIIYFYHYCRTRLALKHPYTNSGRGKHKTFRKYFYLKSDIEGKKALPSPHHWKHGDTEAANTAQEKKASVSAYIHIHILNRPSKNIVVEAFTAFRSTALELWDIQKYKV